MLWISEKLKATPVPLMAWLVGLAAFTVMSVESMLVDSHAVFVFARLTAYITSLTVAALAVGLVGLFGVGCGLMLWWLEDVLSVRRIARSVGISIWPVAAYTWMGVVLLLVEPPAAMTMEDIVRPLDAEAEVADVLAFEWLVRLRYVVTGCFLALVAWLLSRRVKPFNAILAVACGAALVAALVSMLDFLATAIEPELGT